MSQKQTRQTSYNRHSHTYNGYNYNNAPVPVPVPVSIPASLSPMTFHGYGHKAQGHEWESESKPITKIKAIMDVDAAPINDRNRNLSSPSKNQSPSPTFAEASQLDQNSNINNVNGIRLNVNNEDQNQNQLLLLPADKRALTFAADACALCCLQFTGAFILTLYMIQIAMWSWAFHQVYTGMPQTFAWEKLLRTYGSHYDDCIDRSTDIEIELKSSEICSSFYTMPCIPIIAVVLLLLNLFSGSSCLSNPRSKRVYKMVASSTTWQFIFTILALVFASIYFHRDILSLEQSMTREMLKGVPETSRWELTQIVNKCCGLRNPADWNNFYKNSNNNTSETEAITDLLLETGKNGSSYEKLKLPSSCFLKQHEGSGQQNTSEKSRSTSASASSLNSFEEPCYKIEYWTVRYWATMEIALLCAGLVSTMFFFCLATAIHGGAREVYSRRRHHEMAQLTVDGVGVETGSGSGCADCCYYQAQNQGHGYGYDYGHGHGTSCSEHSCSGPGAGAGAGAGAGNEVDVHFVNLPHQHQHHHQHSHHQCEQKGSSSCNNYHGGCHLCQQQHEDQYHSQIQSSTTSNNNNNRRSSWGYQHYDHRNTDNGNVHSEMGHSIDFGHGHGHELGQGHLHPVTATVENTQSLGFPITNYARISK